MYANTWFLQYGGSDTGMVCGTCNSHEGGGEGCGRIGIRAKELVAYHIVFGTIAVLNEVLLSADLR